jgi:hypothetical protein
MLFPHFPFFAKNRLLPARICPDCFLLAKPLKLSPGESIMAKNKGGFIWGVLLGAMATAIAGCVVMSRSCKTFMASGGAAKRAPERAAKRKATKVRSAAIKKK